MSRRLWILTFVIAAAALVPPAASAQSAGVRGAAVAAALAPSYQDDYGDWRQQVRVASPARHARWDAAPRGAVRVYHRRFDARWNWRSAPRHHVVYTYYRGDLWFLDPTTGWAYSVDQYGIVYTADPYRGWVYSLGPLTRWTADLLYFFDLYRFDRGYWYCADYDYFVDLWEINSQRDFHTYDTAYSTLWGWEPYWRSPTFISYSINFTSVWVGQVRRHYDYIERNPHYRRELIDSIGLPAVQAVPPRQMSPRAVATTAYWEARDLAAAGFAPPPRRGRDTGRSWEAGTVVDTREAPSNVVEPGAPAPGFNAPLPDARLGIGSGEGRPKPTGDRDDPVGMRGPGQGTAARDQGRDPGDDPMTNAQGSPAAASGGRERDRDDAAITTDDRVKPGNLETPMDAAAPPQFDEPAYTPQPQQPRFEAPSEKPPYEAPREEPRYEALSEKPPYDAPREEPRYEAPREEPRYEAPREEPRYEAPREEPRYEAPREELRYEAPREEPRYEAPREEPRYEAPPRDEPKDEPPPREEPREEPKEDRQEER